MISRSSPSLDPTTSSFACQASLKILFVALLSYLGMMKRNKHHPSLQPQPNHHLSNCGCMSSPRNDYSKARSPNKLLHHPDVLGWLYFLSLNNSRAQCVPKSFLKRTCPYTGDPLNQKHQECWFKKREQTKTMWPNICVTLIEQDGLFKEKSSNNVKTWYVHKTSRDVLVIERGEWNIWLPAPSESYPNDLKSSMSHS